MTDPPDTAVTRRGQTVIPAAIRHRHGIEEGDRVVWLDDGSTIRLIPLTSDPIASLRGTGKGEGLSQRLLANRKKDRERGS